MNIENKIDIIASPESWIEGTAINQLNTAAKLKGIIKAVGLPDLHPGKGIPVGAVFMTRDIIYPHIIGNDIGCGMSLYKSDHLVKKIKLKKWVKKLEEIDNFTNYNHFGSDKTDIYDSEATGSIGGGNHFAELQILEKVYDLQDADKYALDKNIIYLLVHSGSRGLGNMILDKFIREYTAQNGLDADSPESKMYLKEHAKASHWAETNRTAIAHKIFRILGIKFQSLNQLLSCCHNSISEKMIGNKNYFIHRKGATNAGNELLVIPGSRGSLSYLVKPAADTSQSLYSLPHGAGRKWIRNQCKGKLEKRHTREDFLKTKLGSWVVCKNKALLYEEAPEAYKNIEQVIKDMEERKLLKKIAAFKPLITYKP